jgi:hypothetical protein
MRHAPAQPDSRIPKDPALSVPWIPAPPPILLATPVPQLIQIAIHHLHALESGLGGHDEKQPGD